VVVDDLPIGVFDSGLGGLTVVRAIMDDLPDEPIIYFGDTARFPYGPRPLDQIAEFAVQIARHLVDQGVKLVVVACNSATAAALPQVKEAIPVPVVGVIDPVVRAAVRATRRGRIGLIGTEATVGSGAYQRAVAAVAPSVEVIARACPRFVDFVERGDTTSAEVMETAGGYLSPLTAGDVDTVILGCTHYPLLRGAIQHVMGPEVLLLTSGEETASDVYELLSSRGLLRPPGDAPVHRFQSSGDPSNFSALGHRFLGPEFQPAERVSLEPAGSL
jgi:glutamate racemase